MTTQVDGSSRILPQERKPSFVPPPETSTASEAKPSYDDKIVTIKIEPCQRDVKGYLDPRAKEWRMRPRTQWVDCSVVATSVYIW